MDPSAHPAYPEAMRARVQRRNDNRDEIVSATRLRKFIVCTRLPFMDLYGKPEERVEVPSQQRLFDRGLQHEEDVAITRGLVPTSRTTERAEESSLTRGYKDIALENILGTRHHLEIHVPTGEGTLELAASTERLMSAGVDGIYQGVLVTETWWGSPDWLCRERGASRFGGWHYSPVDAKAIAKAPERMHVLPVVFYALQLERLQGRRPDAVFVEGTFRSHRIRTEDHVGATMDAIASLEAMLRTKHDPGPQLGWRCARCAWRDVCQKDARRTGDLSLLPDLRPDHRAALRASGFQTVASLAAARPAALAPIPGVGRRALRVIQQAQSVRDGTPRVLAPEILPSKVPVEVFIDFESLPEPIFQPVVVYGVLVKRGREVQYHQLVAKTPTRRELERARNAFLLFIKGLPSSAPLFHYGAHEKTLLMKIGGAGATAIAQRLVDLYPIVRRGVALPVRSRSLKDAATAFGLRRRSTVADGLEAAALWQEWMTERTPALLRNLLQYNRDDLYLLAGLLAKLRKAASAR